MDARNIPFFNYPALFKSKEVEIIDTIRDVLNRGAYIMQKDLADFENQIKKLIQVKHVFGVADGTNALILALRAAGIRRGDEVVVCAHTYIATAAAVHYVDAVPILVECGPDHMIDTTAVSKAITNRTRAIVPTQLNGRTCDMASLQQTAKKHKRSLIEAAAQALSSRLGQRFAGTFGAAGTFSFYPAKLLGCFGDGGAVVTDNDEIADRLALLRDHGRNPDGEVVAWGTNCRLDNVQAAILTLKLKSFEADILRRREVAAMYQNSLGAIAELTLPPAPEADTRHFDVYQNYELEAEQRDQLERHLTWHGIGTLIQWGGKAVHQHKGIGFDGLRLPVTEKMTSRFLMLPMHPYLSNRDVDFICEKIREFYE